MSREAGAAVHCDATASAALECCDVYGNENGDWVDGIAGQYGVDGNFALDPCFCDAGRDSLYLWNYSPCNQEICGLIGAWTVGCADPQEAQDDPPVSPNAATISLTASPNPFVFSTRIVCAVPSARFAGEVCLGIYDPAGRLVRTVLGGFSPSGVHTTVWSGVDDRGVLASSGIYFLKLRVGEERLTRRLMLLR